MVTVVAAALLVTVRTEPGCVTVRAGTVRVTVPPGCTTVVVTVVAFGAAPGRVVDGALVEVGADGPEGLTVTVCAGWVTVVDASPSPDALARPAHQVNPASSRASTPAAAASAGLMPPPAE